MPDERPSAPTHASPLRRYLPRYLPLVREDLQATYTRDLHKWLIIAPVVGLLAGSMITFVATVILRWVWPPVLGYYLAHPWAIVPGLRWAAS